MIRSRLNSHSIVTICCIFVDDVRLAMGYDAPQVQIIRIGRVFRLNFKGASEALVIELR